MKEYNLLLVDHTRVILNADHTDYINACEVNVSHGDYIAYICVLYIYTELVFPWQGYKHRKAFLATQAPMESTVADFWDMIWETQSRVLVMLCNLEEEGEVSSK